MKMTFFLTVSAAWLLATSSQPPVRPGQLYNMSFDHWSKDKKGYDVCYGSDASEAQKKIWGSANGTTAAMHEGGSATPQGLFHVGSAFYQDDAPQTGLDVFPITHDTYWVDDPDSPNYNQLVVGDEALGDDHAEHMSEISSYHYGFVIEYNMPPTGYAAGSAIFFHVSHDSPTLGCVSVSEQKVLAYLAKLDASKNPYILII